MKKTIFVVLLFISSYSLIAQFEDLTFGTDSTFEVVTWNMEWFPKNGQATIGYISQIIEALDVDVIAVQEIDDQMSFEQLIEDLDGWDGYWYESEYLALGYIYKNNIFDDIGIYQILTDSYRELPRSPLVLELSHNNDHYVIINNHLKCCGDGYLNYNDDWDEEKRRYDACVLQDQYIVDNFPDSKVIMLGDLNDLIQEPSPNNVFQVFIDNPESYRFVDMDIAMGNSNNWSYPSWPSHLDHVLITNELYDDFGDDISEIETIRVDEYFEEGFDEYDEFVSDHLPVGLKLPFAITSDIINASIVNSEMIVYPNPIIGKAKISFSAIVKDTKLEIYGVNGQLVLAKSIMINQTSFDWNTESLPGGIYFARLISDNKIGVATKIMVLEN